MKKVLCIILCCVLILPLISGCSKDVSFEGTIWVNEFSEFEGIEFFENGICKHWKLVKNESKYMAEKKFHVVEYQEECTYKITGDKIIFTFSSGKVRECEFEKKGKYLYLNRIDDYSHTPFIFATGRKLSSFKELTDLYGLELKE